MVVKLLTNSILLAVFFFNLPPFVCSAEWQTVEITQKNKILGDANCDQSVNITDAISILRYLFSGEPAPSCLDLADVTPENGAGVNITDVVRILQSLFMGKTEYGVGRVLGADPIIESQLPQDVFNADIILRETNAEKIIIKYAVLKTDDHFTYEILPAAGDARYADGYKIFIGNEQKKDLIYHELFHQPWKLTAQPQDANDSNMSKVVYGATSAYENTVIQIKNAPGLTRDQKAILIKTNVESALTSFKNAGTITHFILDTTDTNTDDRSHFRHYFNYYIYGLKDFQSEYPFHITIPKTDSPDMDKLIDLLDQLKATENPPFQNYQIDLTGDFAIITFSNHIEGIPDQIRVDLMNRAVAGDVTSSVQRMVDDFTENVLSHKETLAITINNNVYRYKYISKELPAKTFHARIMNYINQAALFPDEDSQENPEGQGGGAAASTAPFHNVRSPSMISFYLSDPPGTLGIITDFIITDLFNELFKYLKKTDYNIDSSLAVLDDSEFLAFYHAWEIRKPGGLVLISTHGSKTLLDPEKEVFASTLLAGQFTKERYAKGFYESLIAKGFKASLKYSEKRKVFDVSIVTMQKFTTLPRKDILFLGSCKGAGFVQETYGLAESVVYEPNKTYIDTSLSLFTNIINGMTGGFGTANLALVDAFRYSYRAANASIGNGIQIPIESNIDKLIISLQDIEGSNSADSEPDPNVTPIGDKPGLGIPGTWYLSGDGKIGLRPWIYNLEPWGDVGYKIIFSTRMEQRDILAAFDLEASNAPGAEIIRKPWEGKPEWLSDHEVAVYIDRKEACMKSQYFKIKLYGSYFRSAEAAENGSFIAMEGRNQWDNDLTEHTIKLNDRVLRDGFRGYRAISADSWEDDFFYGFVSDAKEDDECSAFQSNVGNYLEDNPFAPK